MLQKRTHGLGSLGCLRAGHEIQNTGSLSQFLYAGTCRVGKRPLFTNVQEQAPRNAPAYNLLSDCSLWKIRVAATWTQKCQIDIALRAIRAVNNEDLEFVGGLRNWRVKRRNFRPFPVREMTLHIAAQALRGSVTHRN